MGLVACSQQSVSFVTLFVKLDSYSLGTKGASGLGECVKWGTDILRETLIPLLMFKIKYSSLEMPYSWYSLHPPLPTCPMSRADVLTLFCSLNPWDSPEMECGLQASAHFSQEEWPAWLIWSPETSPVPLLRHHWTNKSGLMWLLGRVGRGLSDFPVTDIGETWVALAHL